jgi:uncharacterized protein YbaA (DUF1428 family)
MHYIDGCVLAVSIENKDTHKKNDYNYKLRYWSQIKGLKTGTN